MRILPIRKTYARIIVPDFRTVFMPREYQFKAHFLADNPEITQAVILPFIREIGMIKIGAFGHPHKV